MNLFIEHNAATIAHISGQQTPSCDSLIIKRGKADDVLAAVIGDNPLSRSWLFDLDLPSSRVMTWSGTLADDLFASDPRTWMRPGREAFDAFCNDIAPQLEQHQRRLCFHPHSRHVLSDVQSCAKFLRDRENEPFEIALAPASLLEPSMMTHVEDHLRRMFETLGGTCAMLLLHDVRICNNGEDGEAHCEAAALGDGLLPRDLVAALIEQHVPRNTPIVLLPERLDRQLAWLGVEK